MATNYSTLGLKLNPPPSYSTNLTSTDTGAPSPSGITPYPIGTGRSNATGTETSDRGGDPDQEYTGSLNVTQIDKLTSAPVNQSAKTYNDTVKGWIEEKIDYALAPTVEYNPVTGSYRATGPGGGITGMMGPLGGMMQFAAEISRQNLQGIAEKAYAGKKGYAVGMFGNNIIAVSPGLFGDALSGNLPTNISIQQRQQLADQLKGLENRSGAYDPSIQSAYEDGTLERDFTSMRTTGMSPEQYYNFDPSAGPFASPTFAPTPSYTVGPSGGPMRYYDDDGSSGGSSPSSNVPSADNNYGLAPGRSAVMSASGPVRSGIDNRDIVSSRDYSYNDDNNNDGSTGSGAASSMGSEMGDPGFSDFSEEAYGGRIGYAPGGEVTSAADDALSEALRDDVGDYAADDSTTDLSDTDGFGYGDGDDQYRKDIAVDIRNRVFNTVQNQPMTPDERYASNADALDRPDMYSTQGISVSPANKPEEKGFGASIGEAITGAVNAGMQGAAALGALGLFGFREGGSVTEGFVNKDPDMVSDKQSIADNRYTTVKVGSFVMNQPANEKNEKKLDKIVADASKRAKMKKGGKANMMKVALSDGERLIEPEVVAVIEKKHGKGFLDKLNDKGKPEVQRRQAKYGEKIGAAEGGAFIDQGISVTDVGEDVPIEDYLPVSPELKERLSKFANRKPQRGEIKSFIKSLSPEEKLTVLFLTETKSSTDSIEGMEAIGEVVNNRINSDYYDFANIKTLDDALLKQTKRGAFQFSGLEPTTFFNRAKEVKGGVANQGLARAFAAAQNVLDPEREGANRLDPNTLFYTRKDARSQWMRESKDLEFSTELGEHEFYRTFASEEFP